MKLGIFLFFFIFPLYLGAVDIKLGNQAYLYTQQILSFGERSLTSSEHKDVQNFLKNKLTQLGLSVNSSVTQAKTPLGKLEITNLIGVLHPALPKRKERIIFLAHYDSKKFRDISFLGADDAGSSVGLLLALAEFFSNNPLTTITLEFVFLDGEEAIENWTNDDSLYGSRALSKLWKKNNKQEEMIAMILLDMVGGKKASFCKEGNSDRAITNEIWYIAKQKGLQDLFKSDCMSYVQDDHIPFLEEGFPMIDIIAYPFPLYWHTKEDTIENISADTLSKVGSVLVEYTLRQEEIARDN